MHSLISKTNARSRGFSLIELMFVVAIVAIMASFATAAYRGYLEDARTGSAIADIGRIAIEAERFATNNEGTYPVTLADMGLAAMTDPWGNPYRYLSVEAAGGPGPLRKDKNGNPVNTDFDLYSLGVDGASALPLDAGASEDDVVRARNGNYVGLGEEF